MICEIMRREELCLKNMSSEKIKLPRQNPGGIVACRGQWGAHEEE